MSSTPVVKDPATEVVNSGNRQTVVQLGPIRPPHRISRSLVWRPPPAVSIQLVSEIHTAGVLIDCVRFLVKQALAFKRP
jgi:hypothetical protein